MASLDRPIPGTDTSTPVSVTVRYWAAARSAAGVREEVAAGVTVGDVLAEVRRRHADNDRFARVLAVCALLLGDRPLGSVGRDEVALAEGDVLEVLPPFAGG